MRAVIIATLTAAALVAGCATTPEEQSPAKVEDRAAGKPAAVETKPIARVDLTGKPAAGSPLKDPNNILSKRSIYYDYDKFEVKDEFRPLIEAHAKYLRENPGAKMLIQGNADERGSREYNVGLGQRRSDSVRRALMLLGAKENQIESVSLGEEKPVCTEHAEDCWAKNRRGDMLYGGEY
ncbi:MAG TPA: peptidoglycan-associated lipoprotein Pal [Burkholderiales bacterium]|nr:peptidoglycan-associated lipoprotein Pal [Burkholderiales bacterium]